MEHSDLLELISYDPLSGVITWKTRKIHMFCGPNPKGAMNAWNKRHAGKPAFASGNGRGYNSGVLFGKRFSAHRIAWFLHYGEWPVGQLDHINGDGKDNRIANLREVTPAQNQYNTKERISKFHRGGLRGAQYHKRNKKWAASIRIHLGYFDTAEDAHEAYEKAAKQFHKKHYLPNGQRET